MNKPTKGEIDKYLGERKTEFDDLKSGWLAPDGTFYGTYYYEHSEFARTLYAYLAKDTKETVINNAQNALIDEFKWVSIHRADIMFGGKYMFNFAKKLTQEQIRVLKPIVEENKECLDNWCRRELLYALDIEDEESGRR